MRSYTPAEIASGVTFAWAYHRKLRAYFHKPSFAGAFGRRGPEPSDPNFVHYVLAAQLADALGVPHDDYIEALFCYEHRTRGRHPQARFLHPSAAADRIQAWRLAREARPTGRVLAEGRRERGSQQERFALQERYLQQLCARWSAEPEDILRAFGGSEAGVFDPAWLRTQPTWRRLEAEGHFARHPGPDIAYLRERRPSQGAASTGTGAP
jgi:hypothetical protein